MQVETIDGAISIESEYQSFDQSRIIRFEQHGLLDVGDEMLWDIEFDRYLREINQIIAPNSELSIIKDNTESLFSAPLENGVQQSIRENKSVQGIGPFEQAILLRKYPKHYHFQLANSILGNMQHESEEVRRFAAKIAIKICIPMIRLFENSEVLIPLENMAMSILDPDNFSEAMRTWEEITGQEYPNNQYQLNQLTNTFQRRLCIKISEMLGVSAELIKVNFRIKSLLSFYQKYLEGRSQYDCFAATIIIDEEILRSVSYRSGMGWQMQVDNIIFNQIMLPIQQHCEITEIDNIYRNPREYNPEYLAYQADLRNIELIDGMSINMELRIARTEDYSRNISDHPHYKIKYATKQRKLVTDEITRAIGDAAINNSEEYQLDETQTTMEIVDSLISDEETVALKTKKGTHLVFISREGSIGDQLIAFASNISKRLSEIVSSYRVYRTVRHFGEYQQAIYRIQVSPETKLFLETDEGEIDISYSIDTFSLQDFDHIEALEEINEKYYPILTINSLLNMIVTQEVDELPIDEIIARYPHLTLAMIEEIKSELLQINQLPLPQRKRMLKKFLGKLYNNPQLTRAQKAIAS